MNPGTIMDELERAAGQLDAASTKLAESARAFEGGPDSDGVWQPGPQLRYEEQVDAEAAAIYEAAVNAGEKVPPEAIRLAKARAVVKARDPELYADYHRLRSEIASLQKWIGAKKETISARQSVLSAEKALMGMPQGRAG